jgi:hypothetical protein
VRLQLSQKIRDLRGGPIDGADELPPHDSIAVDDICLGKLERPVKIVALLPRIADREQIHIVILQELVVSILVDIYADPNHNNSFAFHAPLHLDQ